MNRSAKIAVVVLFCLGVILLIRWEWRFSRRENAPGDFEVPIPSPALAQAAAVTRPLEEPVYYGHIGKMVDDLVSKASGEDSQSLAADVKALPTDSLPLLKERIDQGNVPAGASDAMLDALTADQARLKVAQKRRKDLNWFRDHSLKIFARNVPEGSPGAEDAWDAVTAAVYQRSGDFCQNGDEQRTIWDDTFRAVQSGCHDPLLMYITAQTLSGYQSDLRKVDQLSRQAEMAMQLSDYPPYFKLLAALRAAQHLAWTKPTGDADQQEIGRLIDFGRINFPQVVADGAIPRDAVVDLFDIIGQTSYAVYGDRQKLVREFMTVLEGSRVDRSTALSSEGLFYTQYAWDARGNGWASTVTELGSLLMSHRLTEAAADLEEAWQLDPTNANAATQMIGVELGQGQGRDRMETWFKRAMQADPDHYSACESKLNYLEPKWYGSAEDMIAFGREMAGKTALSSGQATGFAEQPRSAWVAGLPYILVEAHLRAAQYAAKGWQNEPDPQYFKDNAEAWDDIHFVFVQYLAHRPPSVHTRLMYAKLAGWCGHWAEAHEMFEKVGDVYDWTVFATQADENAARDQAAGQAGH